MGYRVEGEFYDADDWEPDGPSLFDLIDVSATGARRLVLNAWQVHMIEQILAKEGRSRKAIQTYLEQLKVIVQPVFEHMNKVAKVLTDMHKQCEPILNDMKPPKNGPKYNPHARRGKGGRR